MFTPLRQSSVQRSAERRRSDGQLPAQPVNHYVPVSLRKSQSDGNLSPNGYGLARCRPTADIDPSHTRPDRMRMVDLRTPGIALYYRPCDTRTPVMDTMSHGSRLWIPCPMYPGCVYLSLEPNPKPSPGARTDTRGEQILARIV